MGALFAWASLYKHIAFFFAAAMALAHLAHPPEGSSRKQAFCQVLLMAVVGFLAWGLTGLYFFLAGNFSEFWDAVFVFSQFYAGGMIHNLWTGLTLSILLPKAIFFVLPLIVTAALGMALVRRWMPMARSGGLFLAYIISTYIMVAIPGRFFPHYYQYWLPVLSIGAAWSLVEFQKGRANINSRFLRRGGAVVFLLLLLLQASYFRFPPEGWSQLKYRTRFLHMQEATKKIDKLLLPDETFYVWGFDPGLFFYTKRRPVTGVNDPIPLLVGPLTEKLSDREKDQLSKNLPELFVVAPIGEKERPLYRWIAQYYQPFPDQ